MASSDAFSPGFGALHALTTGAVAVPVLSSKSSFSEESIVSSMLKVCGGEEWDNIASCTKWSSGLLIQAGKM